MSEPTSRRWRARPESWWWISLVVLVPVAALTGIAALVLATTTHPTSVGDQIDLVRTALSVGAGTGTGTGAGFATGAYVHGATFGRTTHFTGVKFCGQTLFAETSFAAFNLARFAVGVVFRLCKFSGPAYFMNANFTMGASFDRAVFTDAADFENATFALGNRPGTSVPWMILDDAKFARGVPPELAQLE